MDVPAVALDLAGPSAARVRRLVEGRLGWPVVPDDDEVVPIAVCLRDVPASRRRPLGVGGPPVILVVDDDDPVSAAAGAVGAAAVVPADVSAEGLSRVVHAVRRAPEARRPWATVAASAGGVGATTVAAALAGLRAWHHGRTLLVVHGEPHHADVPSVGATDLASPATWVAGAEALGLDGLRVVRWADAGPRRSPSCADPAVVELGVMPGPGLGADVVVVRADRAGERAAATCTGRALVVVGEGLERISEAVDAAVVVHLPISARVAAAAAAGRLPAGLPGRWLRLLTPVHVLLEQHRLDATDGSELHLPPRPAAAGWRRGPAVSALGHP